LQEIASPKTKLFVCGDEDFEPVTLSAAVLFALHIRSQPEAAEYEVLKDIDTGNALTVLHFQGMCAEDSRLLTLLGRCRPALSLDARDKVYAVLGLAADVETGALLPDYTLSWQRIYINVAVWSILHSQSLEIFSFCSFEETRDKEIPSWVPDWRFMPNFIPFTRDFKVESSWQHIYHSSGDSYLNPSADVFSENKLRLDGFLISRIKTLGEPAIGDDVVQKSWAPIHSQDIYHWTGETLEDAYLHTIVADFNRNQQPVGFYVGRGHAMDWTQEYRLTPSFFQMIEATMGRRFAYTENGLMGLVPASTQIGDSLFVLDGGQMLYILRSISGNSYHFIGEAYFHGMMDGQAIQMLANGDFQLGQIVLE
jgi:hypothetical protein